ncbi:IPExxxVDY family protein [Reichenbachiella versicolor]|uniref:IPExxxVDY family protein n=1 Tax=Reichenbachiella versicolor TaxID=1821036 RepID=UPI0013A540C6|nr:IPExxxVDY family protein [Reichenbachiella versicolor]
MKKVKLQSDVNFDFHLIGIISNAREYTVCWSINHTLKIDLKKEPDIELVSRNDEKQMVSICVFENDFIRYSLVSNKVLVDSSQRFKPLLPTLAHFDYLLKVEVFEEVEDVKDVFMRLRDAEKIDSILKLDVRKIKEKESLIF